MTEILTAIISTIASPEGVYGLGWLFAIGEGMFIAKRLWTESQVVKELRAELKDIQKNQYEAMLAEKESRLGDLKAIIDSYQAALDKIARSINRLGK